MLIGRDDPSWTAPIPPPTRASNAALPFPHPSSPSDPASPSASPSASDSDSDSDSGRGSSSSWPSMRRMVLWRTSSEGSGEAGSPAAAAPGERSATLNPKGFPPPSAVEERAGITASVRQGRKRRFGHRGLIGPRMEVEMECGKAGRWCDSAKAAFRVGNEARCAIVTSRWRGRGRRHTRSGKGVETGIRTDCSGRGCAPSGLLDQGCHDRPVPLGLLLQSLELRPLLPLKFFDPSLHRRSLVLEEFGDGCVEHLGVSVPRGLRDVHIADLRQHQPKRGAVPNRLSRGVDPWLPHQQHRGVDQHSAAHLGVTVHPARPHQLPRHLPLPFLFFYFHPPAAFRVAAVASIAAGRPIRRVALAFNRAGLLSAGLERTARDELRKANLDRVDRAEVLPSLAARRGVSGPHHHRLRHRRVWHRELEVQAW
eukprot:m.62256 g.62256  ORF g.62256 m.62256 type:complete len:425 (+) comp9606_c0_seq3:323-1597(+)